LRSPWGFPSSSIEEAYDDMCIGEKEEEKKEAEVDPDRNLREK